MGRFLVRQPKGLPGVWVTRRDYQVFKSTGRAIMPDLVRVESQYVIVEMDGARARPVALANTNPGKSYRKDHFKAIRRLLPKRRNDRAVRVSDLVTLDDIAKRTGRHASTVISRWMLWDNWPEPITVLGASRVWYWPDVRQAIIDHGLPLVRKEGKDETVHSDDQTQRA